MNLLRICYHGDLAALREYIKSNKRDINFIYMFDNIVKYGHMHLIRYLVNNYRSSNIDRMYIKNSILCIAVTYGNISILKYVIKKGADITTNNNQALYYSSLCGHLHIVKYLINKRIYDTKFMSVALVYASQEGRLNIAKYLIKKKVNINDDNGCALRRAVLYGHIDMIKYLVSKGANIHVIDEYALRCSIELEYIYIVKYLLKKGAILNIQHNLITYGVNYLHVSQLLSVCLKKYCLPCCLPCKRFVYIRNKAYRYLIYSPINIK